jgi:hypothetical protein
LAATDRIFLLLVFALISISLARAQDSKVGPRSSPPFCPPQTCLYYAGDFDSHNSNANGLFNANSSGIGEGQVWVGVKPTADVTVTGATFNQCMAMGVETGVNPTPFEVRAGVKPGQAGKTVCRTHGTAIARSYQFSQICDQASFTIKKLSKSCKLSKNKTYFVNMLPTYNDHNYGFLSDVEDKPAQNHTGWKNLWDDSYFNSVSFGENYEPTWGSGGACNGIGCDAFSIALTGTRR